MGTNLTCHRNAPTNRARPPRSQMTPLRRLSRALAPRLPAALLTADMPKGAGPRVLWSAGVPGPWEEEVYHGHGNVRVSPVCQQPCEQRLAVPASMRLPSRPSSSLLAHLCCWLRQTYGVRRLVARAEHTVRLHQILFDLQAFQMQGCRRRQHQGGSAWTPARHL